MWEEERKGEEQNWGQGAYDNKCMKCAELVLKRNFRASRFQLLKTCVLVEFLKIKSYLKGIRKLSLKISIINDFIEERILLKHK